MCKRSLLFSVIFLLSVIISPFCFVGVDAAAAEPVYKQLTPQEAYAFYGDSMQAVYYSQSGYKSVTLHPSANRYSYYLSGTITGQNVPSWLNNTDLRYVVYSATVSDYSMNPSYLGIDVAPNVHFADCTALRFAACGYLGGSHVSSASYESSFINLYAGGQLRYENGLYTDSNNYYPEIQLSRGGGSWTNSIVWADYSSDTVNTVSMVRVGLNGVRTDSGYLDVYLLCPLVNDTAVLGTGVITGTTDTTAPSGGSTVDMTETNSLLDRIKSGISSLGDGLSSLGTHILDGIASIFVPSEGFMDDQIQEVKDSFVWYEQIQAVGTDLKTVFGQEEFNEAPVVTLHASQMVSSWSGKSYFAEDEVLLDFSDFADYRTSIHTILSVLLWVFFLWRLFARLPDIIHGAGIATADTLNISRELDGRCDDAAQDVVNSSSRFFR